MAAASSPTATATLSSIASSQHEEYNSFIKECFKINFFGINIPVTAALLDLAKNAAV
jgi:hypothetical protein